MLRDSLVEKGVGNKNGFRWRGGEITRFEGLSDAVFAFAVTLLIVSLEVPRTFGDLLVTMRGFGAFAICFVLLMTVWYQQYIFFRRYALQDVWTIVLNSALLFVVLFYIYPLKFLFSLLVNQVMNVPPELHRADGSVEAIITSSQMPTLMIVYGAGYLAISIVFALLFWHAYRQRNTLALTKLEEFDTLGSIGSALIGVAVPVISIIIALIGGPNYGSWAGLIYPILFMPGYALYGVVQGRRRRKLERRVMQAIA